MRTVGWIATEVVKTVKSKPEQEEKLASVAEEKTEKKTSKK